MDACRALPRGANAADHDTPRIAPLRLHRTLVKWGKHHRRAVAAAGAPPGSTWLRTATSPPLLDLAGGGSIPLEAQRFGLEAHASDQPRGRDDQQSHDRDSAPALPAARR
ncbi:MAG: hypothetical protein R2856_27940 [Caldilineaceae bacterium]